MNGIEPVVRHMLLCDDIQRSPQRPRKVDILGLTRVIIVPPDATFPFSLPVLTVYLELTSGRGSGQVKIIGVEADTNEVVFETPERPVQFSDNPLAVQGLVFRILGATFPASGLYWVRFCYNGKVLAEQPLAVRDVP